MLDSSSRESYRRASELLGELAKKNIQDVLQDSNKDIGDVAFSIYFTLKSNILPLEDQLNVLRSFCDVIFMIGYEARNSVPEIPEPFKE